MAVAAENELPAVALKDVAVPAPVAIFPTSAPMGCFEGQSSGRSALAEQLPLAFPRIS
jgi:hypothetical protein